MSGTISQRLSGRTAPQLPTATTALQPALKGLTSLLSRTLPKTPSSSNKPRALKSLSESTSEGAQPKTGVITEQRLDGQMRRDSSQQ